MKPSDFAKDRFREQLASIDSSDLEIWLSTSYSYISDYFKDYSNQAMSFHSLITYYKINMIGSSILDKSHKNDDIKRKACDYLKSFINYIDQQEMLKQNQEISASENKPLEQLEINKAITKSKQDSKDATKSIINKHMVDANMVQKFWHDPVWSKVIAAGIIALTALVYAKIKSYMYGITFAEAIKTIFDMKIRIVFIIVILIVFLILRSILKKRNSILQKSS